LIRPGGSQLETVKHAKAIDHSSDMVQIAIEKNQEAVSEGRVEIVVGNAESLPWGDNSLVVFHHQLKFTSSRYNFNLTFYKS